MTESHQTEDVAVHNERSLKKLAWAIEASVGQFKLLLARCNYTSLRSQLVEPLQELTSVEVRILELKTSEKTLYARIQAELDSEQPDALMVFGLESVGDLDELLTATNQVREEFRKNCHFPLVLWVNDQVMEKLLRLAPDFESWATTVAFLMAPEDLANFLIQTAEQWFTDHLMLTLEACLELQVELEATQKDLLDYEQVFTPELAADCESLLGFIKRVNNQIDIAIEHYQSSLVFWQQTNNLRRQAKLLDEISFCYYLKAPHYRFKNHPICQDTRYYVQEYLRVIEQLQRPDLITNSILRFGEVLGYLQDCEKLQVLAQQALQVHQAENKPIELARDYGFLAEVALAQERWNDASEFARKALQILLIPSSSQSHNDNVGVVYELFDKSVVRNDPKLYLFILAKSQQHLGQLSAAICNLEAAREVGMLRYDPQLYLDILSYLQRLYFEQKDYLKAFEIKQEYQSIEQQYGLRAFIGAGRIQPQRQTRLVLKQVVETLHQTYTQETIAPEITASGRQLDVERLIRRIGRNDCKLIVIHGESGVGKSSLVYGGLVPALKQKAMGTSDVLPVAMRVYTSWVEQLGKLLAGVLEEKGIHLTATLDSEAAILEQLQQSEPRNLRTVLIFDQFEEFFFVYPDSAQRRRFFEFVGACLNILPVKVILSLRKDYLHYLLECNRLPSMKIIGNDILTKNVLYELGNFSPADAKAIIQRLTDVSNFHLETALIEQLVQDLADNLGEVRPIELQIVGAQLQTENITTLAEYRQRGQKEELVKRYLAEVVEDCGAENEQVAELVLYLLTDEKGTCPLKTRAELERDLQVLVADLTAEANRLDLVFKIFVDSGLVVLLPELPADRYQLVHDYLAVFIRQQQEPRLNELIAELDKERGQRKRSEAELNRILKRRLREAYIAGLVFAVLSVLVAGFWVSAEQRRKRVEIAEIEALNSTSEARLTSNNQLEALIAGVKAGKRIQETVASPEIKQQTLDKLRQAIQRIQEYNRLENHSHWVLSASFSPDGETLASASADKTIKLWKRDGTLLKTLQGHNGNVWMVSFSPNGQILASASADKTIKLWKRDGTLLKTLQGHQDEVTSVSFSPDGETFASTSVDKTIKLWSRDGTLLKTLPGHQDGVISVSFSPDGQTLASASMDKTIKLWSRDGTLLKTLLGHQSLVWSVSFSPDGQTLASASWDNTIKLWSKRGVLLKTLQGHTSRVLSVSFSPDGQTLASAGLDGAILLWQRDGKLLTTLRGHTEGARFVSFSPNGQTIVSASLDKTIRLWKYDNPLLKSLQGHNARVASVSFSPDGQLLASASKDKTIKLWSRDGNLLKTLQGHTARVTNVSFDPNGQTLASASADKTIKLWSRDGKLLTTFRGHHEEVWSVRFSPNGKILASASADKTIKLWRRDGKLIKTLQGHQEEVNSISFSSDGQTLASASNDKTIKFWSLNGTLLKTLQANQEGVTSISFSPDSKIIASAGFDNTIKLWSRNGILLKTLSGHRERIWSVNFSPDSQLVVSASADSTIKLWNLDGLELQTLQEQNFIVWDVSFSPDGQMIASGSDDVAVKLWRLNRQKLQVLALNELNLLLSQGCNWLNNYLKTNLTVRKNEANLCESIVSQ